MYTHSGIVRSLFIGWFLFAFGSSPVALLFCKLKTIKPKVRKQKIIREFQKLKQNHKEKLAARAAMQ